MMSVLYKNIDWRNIKYIGFDMDGTLYDEYEFIIQPYTEISGLFLDSDKVLSYMSERWLGKGSSYNRIFDEAYDEFTLIVNTRKEDFIGKALSIFRDYDPELSLTSRVNSILEYVEDRYTIFLVSDGNPKLQRKKFFSLGLDRFFDLQNVVFTGLYSMDYHKPNIRSLELLNIKPEHSVFFGDRGRDKEFSVLSKMQFKKVYNMIEV